MYTIAVQMGKEHNHRIMARVQQLIQTAKLSGTTYGNDEAETPLPGHSGMPVTAALLRPSALPFCDALSFRCATVALTSVELFCCELLPTDFGGARHTGRRTNTDFGT